MQTSYQCSWLHKMILPALGACLYEAEACGGTDVRQLHQVQELAGPNRLSTACVQDTMKTVLQEAQQLGLVVCFRTCGAPPAP
jgi:hypothetical protein